MDVALTAVAEKAAQGNEMVALGQYSHALALFVLVAVQPESPFADQFTGDFFDLYVAGKLDESFEVEMVVLGSFLSTATLDFEVLDKIHDQF